MKQTRLVQTAVAVSLVNFLAGSAQAAGFGLYEASARGNAMGGALIGRTGDASAAYYNPANMTQNPGTQLMLGVTLINPHAELTIEPTAVTGYDRSNLTSAWFPPPHVYLTHQINDRLWIGFGSYTEFGLGTKYKDQEWEGAFNAQRTKLQSFTFNPNIAFKATDKLSFSAGFRAIYLDFFHRRKVGIPNVMDFGTMEINADGWGYGANFGLNYAITDDLDFGLHYRTQVDVTLHGNAERRSSGSKMPVPVPGVGIVPIPVNDHTYVGGEAKVTLPASVAAGLNWRITPKWSAGMAVTWTEWSTFDSLDIYFNSPTVTTSNPQASAGKSSISRKNWKDVLRFGFGTEYTFNENWAIQTGYVYDMSPNDKDLSDFMIPPGNRHMFGLGASYMTGPWTFNLSYNFMILTMGTGYVDMIPNGTDAGISVGDRKSRVEMSDAYSHFIGFSVGYKF